jgi:histidinol-phosphate/aromatic aminotransferase/cobyric acid decarboxylase-like protein
VLNQCDQLGIPVLIDCAFFGICQDIEFNFDRPCITDITFSLSKSFAVANLRIGMRLTRYDDDDSLLVHQITNYNNRLACGVGLELIERYSADYNVETWSAAQAKFCEQIGVTPSKSVVFGLGGEAFSKYNRGGTTNRLCFSKYLYSGILPND